MMQKDIRVSLKNHIHFNHISILQGDMFFFRGVIGRYGVEIRLKQFPYLQYLLRDETSEMLSIFKYFSTIQKKSYHNYITAQNVTNFYSQNIKENRILLNQNSLHNKIYKEKSQNVVNIYNRELQESKTILNNSQHNRVLKKESQNIVNIYNRELQKNRTILNNSLYNRVFKKESQNIVNFYNEELQENRTILNNSLHNRVNIYNRELQESKTILNQNLLDNKTLKEESHNRTSFYYKNSVNNISVVQQNRLESIEIVNKNPILSYKKVIIEKNYNRIDTLSTKILNNRTTLKESNSSQSNLSSTIELLTHQHRVVQQNQSIYNETENRTIIYPQKEENRVLSEPTVEKVVEKIIKERETVERTHNDSLTVTNIDIINNFNPYEIKKLATKIYPLIMTQWQKEFERRGVFYG